MPQKWFYSEDLDNEICEWIADGKTLRDYSRQEGKPPFRVIYEWRKERPDFAERFAHARESGHDVIADDILAIVDVHPPSTASGGTDGNYVSWQKNRAWTRLQLLAKWNPSRYGDQKKAVELTGPNGGPLQVNTTIVDGSHLDEDTRRAFVEALEAASMAATGEDQPYIDEEEEYEGEE
jgi:hypothetical protein